MFASGTELAFTIIVQHAHLTITLRKLLSIGL